MKSTLTRKKFNPYFRVDEAKAIIKHNRPVSSDVWVNKLVGMFKLRDSFKSEYGESYLAAFEESFPLYADLLNSFEDVRIGGDRDLLEAVIIASADCAEISETLNNPRFTPQYITIYRQLFYDTSLVMSNKAAMFQNIVAPLLKANSGKLSVGVIWKILALSGGLPLLEKKGLGTSAVRAEDMEYLMQLTCFRNLSTMLHYASDGVSFFEENPAAAMTLSALADFDGLRGSGRRRDYIAAISDTAVNAFSSILSGELKLISAPTEVVARLSELDGTFSPDKSGTFEVTKHLTYTEDNIDE